MLSDAGAQLEMALNGRVRGEQHRDEPPARTAGPHDLAYVVRSRRR